MATNFNAQLDALGALLTVTPEQVAAVRARVADQPDAEELLAAMGIGGEE